MPSNQPTPRSRLSEINQKLSLLKKENPGFSELSGEYHQQLEESEKFNELLKKTITDMKYHQAELDSVEKSIKEIMSQANRNNAHNMTSLLDKEKEKMDEHTDFINKAFDESDRFSLILDGLGSSSYKTYCMLTAEKNTLEKFIKDEENKASLLTGFCHDEKQRRLLPFNITSELTHHLSSEWGVQIMKKYPSLSISYEKERIEIVNLDKNIEISTEKNGSLRMYSKPSKNESAANLMIELYFKSIEGRINEICQHSATGPDAEFLGKKIALKLQEGGYLDHKVNGKLVTDILNIKKEVEPLPSSPILTENMTIPSQLTSPMTANKNKDTTPPPKEENEASFSSTVNSKNDPELPGWYIKQLEEDKLAENDSSHSFKMR